MEEFNDVHLAVIRRAHELGVAIAMGTDAGTPGNHHGLNAEECVVLAQQAGLTPQESIRAATTNGARLLRQAEHLGALDPGKFADVIGLRENPLEDITALTRVALVVAAGRLVRHDD
jgi:imidazolonepropionase-like amidohydrolase